MRRRLGQNAPVDRSLARGAGHRSRVADRVLGDGSPLDLLGAPDSQARGLQRAPRAARRHWCGSAVVVAGAAARLASRPGWHRDARRSQGRRPQPPRADRAAARRGRSLARQGLPGRVPQHPRPPRGAVALRVRGWRRPDEQPRRARAARAGLLAAVHRRQPQRSRRPVRRQPEVRDPHGATRAASSAGTSSRISILRFMLRYAAARLRH